MNTRAYIKKKANDKNCLNFVMLSYPWRKLFFCIYVLKKKKRRSQDSQSRIRVSIFHKGTRKKDGWKHEGKIRGYVRGFSLYPDGKIEGDAWIFRFRDTIWYINI